MEFKEIIEVISKDKTCLTCEHFEGCPIILKWVELTEAPIEAVKFYCSEYKVVENV